MAWWAYTQDQACSEAPKMISDEKFIRIIISMSTALCFIWFVVTIDCTMFQVCVVYCTDHGSRLSWADNCWMQWKPERPLFSITSVLRSISLKLPFMAPRALKLINYQLLYITANFYLMICHNWSTFISNSKGQRASYEVLLTFDLGWCVAIRASDWNNPTGQDPRFRSRWCD